MKIFQKKQIPNILSFIRLLMVPVFVLLFFSEINNHALWALTVFIAAGLTDIADGYLARKNNWITAFGKILDPLADKLMQITAFVCIAIKNQTVIFLACLILVKDALMGLGGIVLAKKGAANVIEAKWYGKLTTFVLAITLGTLILFHENQTVTAIMSAISAVMIIFALIMYFSKVFMKYIKQ